MAYTQVIHGECLAEMRKLIDAGVKVDAIVTDPPYHLTSIVRRFGKSGSAPAQFGTDGAFSRASKGFMGKEWDGGDIAFRADTWALCLELLKPGGHLLAFNHSRTWHRMTVAIEDAGFEVRDSIMWMYGTGFPKSHDVSKGIDKKRVEDIEPIRRVCRAVRAAMEMKGLKSKHLVDFFGNCHPRLIDHWAARDTDSQPSLPTWDQWLSLKQVLEMTDCLDAEVWRLNGRKGQPGDAWESREVVGSTRKGSSPLPNNHNGTWSDEQQDGEYDITAPATEAAKQWEGWGSALKPAVEPIVMARKPLDGTIAENVLRHGVGAINVNGCRVAVGAGDDIHAKNPHTKGGFGHKGAEIYGKSNGAQEYNPSIGRWPANVIHDGSDDVLAAFATNGNGNAARFFYSAKASKADRAGSKHPTVKPVSLMRYLCRLVTPPGGVVLDPFAGSGTTLQAAWQEGLNAIGIEREDEYVADIRARLESAKSKASEVMPLFGNTPMPSVAIN